MTDLYIHPTLDLATTNPWYAIQTQPRRETIAEFHLDKICEAVFLPRYRQRVILHGYRKEVTRALFPGYLFAAFERRNFRAVHYAGGVRGVVRFGDEPPEVPADLLQAVVTRMRNGLVVLEPPQLDPGQRVEILAGPFQGYTAIFQSNWTGAERVAVLLDSLRYNARLVLEREAIRPVA
jgi:transcriptional antiterminator RfaH